MRRILLAVALAVISLAAGVILGRPSIVKAGHTAGLTGRTHLIVKEHNLKHLTGTRQGFTPFAVNLFERTRDGLRAASPYLVPPGYIFSVANAVTLVVR
jgi:hypothetical protein